jgi:hypothetical protein
MPIEYNNLDRLYIQINKTQDRIQIYASVLAIIGTIGLWFILQYIQPNRIMLLIGYLFGLIAWIGYGLLLHTLWKVYIEKNMITTPVAYKITGLLILWYSILIYWWWQWITQSFLLPSIVISLIWVYVYSRWLTHWLHTTTQLPKK